MGPAFSKLTFILLANLLLGICDGGCSLNWLSKNHKEPPIDMEAEDEYTRRRQKMVREQLQTRDITDEKVLAAMLKVPRHKFIPEGLIDFAYEDNAQMLSQGQTISQPYIVAYMTQALELRGTERVLEIGTGSGYQVAVLAGLAAEVYTVEILPELQKRAIATLQNLGYSNIHYRVGDGYMGWPEYAPFDRIIVTAAPERVPETLINQLKEGGRMVIPVGAGNQELLVIVKENSEITQRSTIGVRFVPMTGIAREKQ